MKILKFSTTLFAIGILMAAFTVTSSAIEAFDKVDISIQQVETHKDEKLFTLKCINNTGSNFSYGWVDDSDLIITTNNGTYSAPLSGPKKITAGETIRQVTIENCPGEIQKVTVSKLCQLDDRGLPTLNNILNVLIYDNSRMNEKDLNIIEKRTSSTLNFTQNEFKSPKIFKIFLACFFVFFIAVIIFSIILHVRAYRKNKTAQKTFVPFQKNNFPDKEINKAVQPYLNNGTAPISGLCYKCGTSLPEGCVFCPECGTKQVKVYTQIFNRENEKEDLFIDSINTWLMNNPNLFNAQCDFKTRSGYGMLVNRYFLDAVAIRYELSEKTNENQYALLSLEHFGLIKKSTDQLLEEWIKVNPNTTIVNKIGGVHTRGNAGSNLVNDIGSSNKTQLYLFMKFNRNNATGV